MARYKFIVFSNALEDCHQEFNSWYDSVHLPDVLQVPGFVGAERFYIERSGDDIPVHRYLAIYEMDTDDPDGALEELTRRARGGAFEMSDKLADPKTMLVRPLPGDGKI